MQRAVFLFLVLLLLSSGRHPNREEQVIFKRIAYINDLKRLVDKHVWKGFTDKKFDLPLVYYTDRFKSLLTPPRSLLFPSSRILFLKARN